MSITRPAFSRLGAKLARAFELTPVPAMLKRIHEFLLQLNSAQSNLNAQLLTLQAKADAFHNFVENRLVAFEQMHQARELALPSDAAALMSAGLLARHLRLINGETLPPSNYRPARPLELSAYTEKLRAIHPRAFNTWIRLFENGRRSYQEQREASCSHHAHRFARLFGAYLEIYGFGRKLDIGCGPYGLPSYLALHDPAHISAVEPLEPAVPVPFECVRGFNEFLPWPDGSFHTVISGTSLDHVLDLDRSLAEVRRVLTPNGRYVVWLSSIAGARPYDMDAAADHPVDEFHLFHFDRAWLEPLLLRHFEIADATVIPQPGFEHVFYCLTPRRPSPADQRQGRGT